MLTVKEFKGLGVVFVGDVCSRDYVNPFTVNAIWVDSVAVNGFRDKQEVVSFAWRPLNTLPDIPKFKYELKGNNGAIVEYTGDQDLSCTDDESSNGAYFAWVSWRPLLDQSSKIKSRDELMWKLKEDSSLQGILSVYVDDEVTVGKPVFTQAMADAGELPPVGVQCEYYHDPRKLWVKFIPLLITTITTSPNGIPAIYGEWLHPNDFIWEADIIDDIGKTKFRPIDTRTPKQKAVDEMFEDAEVQGSKGAFERLYDKGYRKC